MGGGAGAGGGGGGTGAGPAVDAEYAGARTSVWWDIENCHVPRGCDPHAVAQNIRGALSDAGYRGMVSVSAYGDTNKIPTSVQHALSSTGIALNHVPAGVKDASDKKILVDMLFWAVDNPPPANYLLISGDRDFSNALHQLRMRRYNILLAHSPNVSQALVAAAKCVWLWTSLVAGGPPLQSSEPSQLGSMTNGNGSGMDMPKYSNAETKQSADPPLESTQNRNQKSSGNGKLDSRHKTKQSWKNVNQANITRSSSSEFKQPPVSTKEVLVDGAANTPNSARITSQQQYKQVSSPVSMETELNVQSSHATTSTGMPAPPEMPLPSSSNNTTYHTRNQFKEAPHKFFGFMPPTFNGPPQNGSFPPPTFNRPPQSGSFPPPTFDGPPQSGSLLHPEFTPKKNTVQDNYQAQNPHLLRPSDFLPQQPNLSSGNSHAGNSLKHTSSQQPRPDVPQNLHFTSLAPPQHNGLKNMNHFYGLDVRPPTVPGQGIVSGSWGTPGCPQPSEEALFHIGHILNALYILKTDMMLPTEENIADCIRYRINLPTFNVTMGLDYALRHQMVVKFALGKLSCYTGKNDRMWNCVNIMDINAKHPKTMWDKIQGFLFSPDGQSKVLSSQCRYQAAVAIKKSCLDHLPLGTVLQILNMIVTVKKWLVPHPSGWQPLSFGPM